MPIISYQCVNKHIIKKFFREVKKILPLIKCEECGEDMKKLLSSPSSLSKITVDNGIQARAVEIIPNIVELNQERANKNYKED